jgi:thioredoxin-dependent peroxiredoxin
VQGNVLRDRAKEIEAKNAAILGASFDTVADNKKFAEKFNFTYPLIADTKRELGVKYGAADEATQKTAVRVAYLIGSDGRVRHVWPKATPKTFADEVLAQL